MMAKHIFRRGRSWVVRINVSGAPQFRSFRTRDEATLHLARLLGQRARGETPARRIDVTFREAAEEWYRAGVSKRGTEWKPSTKRDYRSALDAHLLPAFADVRLDRLTAAVITAWRTEAMGRGLPPRTAQKLLAMVHRIFEFSRKRYGVTVNHAADVDAVTPATRGTLDFYSPEEVYALVRAAESEQDGVIFLVAAFAGLRRGELVALRVRNVDFARRTIRVEASYGLGELTSPKSGKVRAVPMATEVARALEDLLKRRGDPDGDELLFVGENESYVDASALRRRYVRAQQRAGLRPLRFHDLRHVFGSTAITRASIVQVQEWMGHADPKTTHRYMHYKAHDGEANLLDEAFKVAQPLGVAIGRTDDDEAASDDERADDDGTTVDDVTIRPERFTWDEGDVRTLEPSA
jgi:integrase